MKREELKEIVQMFRKVYGEKFKIDQQSFDIWCDCLGDLRFDVAKKAATEFIKKSQYAPTVADIQNEYNLLWEEYKAMVRHIGESFDAAAGYYPCITEEQRANGKKIFIDLVSRVGRDKRERTARDISQRIIEYVKKCEAGTSDTIIPFDEYMRTL